MFCETDNILWNILYIQSEWWNILHNTVNLAKHCTGGALYRIFVYHVRWRGICLGAICLQGTN